MPEQIDLRIKAAVEDVPPLPGEIRERVDASIRRSRTMRRSLWAAAASLLIAIGGVGYLAGVGRGPAVAVSPAVTDQLEEELLSINSFANGSDLDETLVQYASLDEGLY